MVRYPPLVEVQRQRSLVWAPYADVVAGLPAAGQVEVDLHAEFFLGHDQFPEQAVARSLPGHRPVPQVVTGAEPVVQLSNAVTAPRPAGSLVRCESSVPGPRASARGYPPRARIGMSCSRGCGPRRSSSISCCRRSLRDRFGELDRRVERGPGFGEPVGKPDPQCFGGSYRASGEGQLRRPARSDAAGPDSMRCRARRWTARPVRTRR